MISYQRAAAVTNMIFMTIPGNIFASWTRMQWGIPVLPVEAKSRKSSTWAALAIFAPIVKSKDKNRKTGTLRCKKSNADA